MGYDTAVLRALTPEAEASLGGIGEVPIESFPFRVGRDSRESTGALPLDSSERTMRLGSLDNHLHLLDDGEPRVISRQHLQIEKNPRDGYLVRDRGSVCGTVVGHHVIGGDRKGGSCALYDGNVIIVGGPDSPYVFQFVVAKESVSS